MHRGHGVFDTAILVEGKLYMLDRHLQRFATSAEKARPIPPLARMPCHPELPASPRSSNAHLLPYRLDYRSPALYSK